MPWQVSKNAGVPMKFDNRKIQADLLVSFTDVDQSLLEMADSMVVGGMVNGASPK